MINGSYWFCEPNLLKSFFETLLKNGLSGEQMESLSSAAAEEPTAEAAPLLKKNGIARIMVRGILVMRIPAYLKDYIKAEMIELSSLQEIRRQILDAADDPEIKEIVLEIDSPGGIAAGTLETAEAIAAASEKKKVRAVIESLGASGAYYLASQAGTIESAADAVVGSIGTYSVYYDASRRADNEGVRVVVIRSGPVKGMGVWGDKITEEQIRSVQEVIDGLAGQFIAAVASGRGLDLNAVRQLADGRTWLAPRAKKLGLIDKIRNGVLFERKKMMEDKELNQKVEAAKREGQREGQAEAAVRLKSLRDAFPDDLEFALSQFEAGRTVEQAKAEYCDVLAKKLAEAKQAIQKLQIELEKSRTVEPLSSGPAVSSVDDFWAKVAEYQAAGMSRGAAVAKAARTCPELHREHLVKSRRKC